MFELHTALQCVISKSPWLLNYILNKELIHIGTIILGELIAKPDSQSEPKAEGTRPCACAWTLRRGSASFSTHATVPCGRGSGLGEAPAQFSRVALPPSLKVE